MPPQPPTARLTVPTSVLVGELFTADASASVDGPGGGGLRKFVFDFGDGTVETSSNAIASHTYTDPDTYPVTVTVWNKKGRSAISAPISVQALTEAPPPPPPPPPPPDPVPVDCVLTPFALASAGPWGACQPDGTQTRTETWMRTVVTPPAHGGAVCGPLTETRTATQACVYAPPPPPQPPGPAPSPNGATGPTITDAAGGVWTLGVVIGGGQATLRNGMHMGGGGAVAYLWLESVVYVRNDANAWYRWTGSAWVPHADPTPPLPPPAPSGLYGPQMITCPPAAIQIAPGTTIQPVVDAHPAGTIYCLKAGAHRLQSITPKHNDQFWGEYGAILSGAKVLTGWIQDGARWYVAGQTHAGTVDNGGGAACTLPRCGYPEDLFVNNVAKQHVSTLGSVGPGTWLFDYAADRIYVGDNPSGQTVETSVTPTAFSGAATGVTVKNLVVEKFATPTHTAAIEASGGSGWTVEHNEVRFNHYGGIRTKTSDINRRNYVHHNGSLGFTGAGANGLVEDNEIAYNGVPAIGYNIYWTSGGSKWVFTTGLIVRRNWSHHNYGTGLWTDIDNIGTLYEHNTVEDNGLNGIFHEISWAAVIRNNLVQRNGFATAYPGWLDGAGIMVAHSKDVEVYGNTVVNNKDGIGGIQSARGSGLHGEYLLTNLFVHENTITMNQGHTGVMRSNPQSSAAVFGAARNNRFENNIYFLASAPANPFAWNDAEINQAGWQGFGHDTPGGIFHYRE